MAKMRLGVTGIANICVIMIQNKCWGKVTCILIYIRILWDSAVQHSIA